VVYDLRRIRSTPAASSKARAASANSFYAYAIHEKQGAWWRSAIPFRIFLFPGEGGKLALIGL